MKSRNIAVIGAGLAGLTAALALLQRGNSVRVFEQSSELGDVGAGIMLTPNVTRLFDALSLEPAVQAAGLEPQEVVYRKFDTAEVILRTPLRDRMLSQYGARYYHIHRADLHRILCDAVRAISADAISVDHRFLALQQTPDRVTVQFANGLSTDCDVLLGADGIRSAVRTLLFDASQPQFTGQVAWRGLVPVEGLPATVTAPSSTAWIGPNRHIIQYPLRGRKIINYVAIVASETWTAEGWNCRSAVSEVVEQFPGWHSDILALLSATNPDQCIKWGLFDREPLDTWTAGRIALLGDAAHPMLPFMAQGAAMSVEDGFVFARAFEAAATTPEAFARYEAARRDRANWVLLQSRAATKLYQNTAGNKDEQRARNIDTLYGYDATAIAV